MHKTHCLPSVVPPSLCRRYSHILDWLLDDYGPQSSGLAHLSVPIGCPRLGAGVLDKVSSPPLPDVASILFCWRQGDGQAMPWPLFSPARGQGYILAFLSHPYSVLSKP